MKKILMVLALAFLAQACTSHEYIYNGVSMTEAEFNIAVEAGKIRQQEKINEWKQEVPKEVQE